MTGLGRFYISILWIATRLSASRNDEVGYSFGLPRKSYGFSRNDEREGGLLRLDFVKPRNDEIGVYNGIMTPLEDEAGGRIYKVDSAFY